MKEYIVDVRFAYDGWIKVKANNREEAAKIAINTWIEEFCIEEGSSTRQVIDVRMQDIDSKVNEKMVIKDLIVYRR